MGGLATEGAGVMSGGMGPRASFARIIEIEWDAE